MPSKRKYSGSTFTCFVAEVAREQGEPAPDHCAGRVSRRSVRFFGGEPYCHHCLLDAMRADRTAARARLTELRSRWNSGLSIDIEKMTDAEVGELMGLEAADSRRRSRRREYARKYRRGELSWQKRRERRG